MEAPEKLFVAIIHPLSNGHTEMIALEHGDGVEYIRKDAFIKKVCEKLKKYMYDNLMFQGRLHRKEVIETFIEDFKKYMEE